MERLREANNHSQRPEILLEQQLDGNYTIKMDQIGHGRPKTDSAQSYLESNKRVEVRYLDGSVQRNY